MAVTQSTTIRCRRRGQLAAQEPPVRTEIVPCCPLCGESASRTWRVGRDRLHGVTSQEFPYARCTACGLIYLSERPLEAEIAAFYPRDYGPYKPRNTEEAAPSLTRKLSDALHRAAGRVLSAVDRLATFRFWRNYEAWYQPAARGQVLLDFGCGSDKFLHKARKQGWRTIGMDFSPQSIEQVRSGGHAGYLADEQGWGQVAEASVDLVRMNHVLEHLYAPRETLARLKARLRPGGKLHIAVPNPASISSRVFRNRWLGLDCPRHIMLYTSTRLRSLLEEAGFTDIQVQQEMVAKDAARSLGFVLADLGVIAPETARSFLDFYTLQLALYGPMWLATALGLGDRLHAFARV